MIRISKFTMALLAITVTASLNAIKVEITPTISKAISKVNKDSLKDDKVLYGLRGSIYLNEGIALQLGGETSNSNKTSDGGRTDIERAYVNLVYGSGIGKRVKPYAIIGAGGERIHRISTPRTNDDSQLFVNAGAGLKFDITDRINLITEAKWLRKLENDDNDIIATVGLGVKLGETKGQREIPSVTQTSQAQNADSLAKLEKLIKSKKVATIVTPITVTSIEVAPAESVYIDESSVPSNASVVQIDVEGYSQSAVSSAEVCNDLVINDPISNNDGYYVQLAALFKESNSPLTSRLDRKNYQYILHDTTRFGKPATLLLVGPYSSKTEAKNALKQLKRFKTDAFIYHLK